MDRITLRGIRAWGHHGVLEFERRTGQPFAVDLTLHVDLAAAGRSDDLADTVDYGGVAALVAERLAGRPVNLIEAVAADIADATLAADPRIRVVEVTVHKPHAPVPVPVDDVEVSIVRQAASTGPGDPTGGTDSRSGVSSASVSSQSSPAERPQEPYP